jgi:hypothetical protein
MAIFLIKDRDATHPDPVKDARGCYKRDWSRESIAWIAGFIEGEGCFKVGRKKNRTTRTIRMELVTTDQDVALKCRDLIGFGNVYVYPNGRLKTQYRYNVNKELEVYALMCAIYPFMGERRKAKIRECIAAWQEKPSRLQTAFGETKPIGEWARDSRCVVRLGTLKSRTSEFGWPLEKALTVAEHGGQRHEAMRAYDGNLLN